MFELENSREEKPIVNQKSALTETDVNLNADKPVCEKVADDFFVFSVKSKDEGRKLGIKAAHAVAQLRLGDNYQHSAVDAMVSPLSEADTIEDFRLDGNQLSYSEDIDPESGEGTVSIFYRYASEADIKRLGEAIKSLGFAINDETTDSKLK